MSFISPSRSRHQRSVSFVSFPWLKNSVAVCLLSVCLSRGLETDTRTTNRRRPVGCFTTLCLKWKRLGCGKGSLRLLFPLHGTGNLWELFICPLDVDVWWKEQVQCGPVYTSFPSWVVDAGQMLRRKWKTPLFPRCLYCVSGVPEAGLEVNLK